MRLHKKASQHGKPSKEDTRKNWCQENQDSTILDRKKGCQEAVKIMSNITLQ